MHHVSTNDEQDQEIPQNRSQASHIPNYMRGTKCMENHFSNAEQDVLRQAFLPTSYIQIRRLPSRIRPGFTTIKRQQDEVASCIQKFLILSQHLLLQDYLQSSAGFLKGSMNLVVGELFDTKQRSFKLSRPFVKYSILTTIRNIVIAQNSM